MDRTKFKDYKGRRLNVGDLVCYTDPELNPKLGWNQEFEIFQICRSIYDERLFLLPLHPYKDIVAEFRTEHMDKKILKLLL